MRAPTLIILALITTPAEARCHKYSHWAYPYPQTCKIYRAYAAPPKLAMKTTGPAIAALKPMFVPPIFIPDIEVPPLPPEPAASPPPAPPPAEEDDRAKAIKRLRQELTSE